MTQANRRDFLKLASAAAGATALSPFLTRWRGLGQNGGRPHVIVIVFDAMSARNLSLYGYPRRTTPNLERFAQRATVYHAHHAAGNFTVPGTASLLTGMYPWTHRAINIGGLIQRSLAERNIFRLVGADYHRLAYSQNLWPNYFFDQFHPDLETVLPPESFSTVSQIAGSAFRGDTTAAHRSYDEFLLQDGEPPASLVFGLLGRLFLRRAAARAATSEYPRGLPRAGNYPIFFHLRDVFEGMQSAIQEFSSPTLAYFHLWSPHAPYRPNLEFEELFLKDGWRPEPKPDHRLGEQIPRVTLNNRRTNYDEYVANVDAEFGRLLDMLEPSGILDQAYVVVTSDHGESFERGVEGHITPLLFEPVIHIPLLISAPGQRERKDTYTPTACVDLLPTVLHLTGNELPDWCEGQVLPHLGGAENPSRSVFALEAKTNPAYAPLTRTGVAMLKGPHKLIYHTGYEREDSFELYDLQEDHEELRDLYPESPAFARRLREELLEKLNSENSRI